MLDGIYLAEFGGEKRGRSCFRLFFFFFQAEDGIRDLTVTGLQTCALPILRGNRRRDGRPTNRLHAARSEPCDALCFGIGAEAKKTSYLRHEIKRHHSHYAFLGRMLSGGDRKSVV